MYYNNYDYLLMNNETAQSMILLADSGSTKTTWLVTPQQNVDNGVGEMRFSTQGINPFHQSVETMQGILQGELLSLEGFPCADCIAEIHFYGAGCTREKSPVLAALLREAFPNALTIEVDSDMLGAAKALFGTGEGIACILGTGANSCLYDGENIVSNVSPMGYILGDEGSGAVIGKTFINLLYKGGHRDFVEIFEKETGLSQASIIQYVYREPMPNRFLASLAPFVKSHIAEDWIEEMVIDCFRLFFQRNVRHYQRPDLPCSFVGSIAFHFAKQLEIAAKKEGVRIASIAKEPL